ncbi:MAG: PhzF family phenazine biosynthesis protein [Rhodobacteraceae bacterium]|nr:PhzF family phenazine biosynthesis protein [Paracoccaceae bacterium]
MTPTGSIRARPFQWIDAFTDQPFGGNPCAVVFDADDIPEETRLAYTRERRLSECAFLQHSPQADFGVRYYLASREIKMAGHPTIATVTALIEAGLVQVPSSFTLEVGAGVIELSVAAPQQAGAPPFITMLQPRPSFGRVYTPGEIADLVGLSPEDVIDQPHSVAVGGPFFVVTLLRDHDSLRRASLNLEKLAAAHSDGVDFNEPFLATLQGATPEGATFSRLLLPPPEPAEDPFTGSATGCLAAYLWLKKRWPVPSEPQSATEPGAEDTGKMFPRFIAEQGHWMGRPGKAEVSLDLAFNPMMNEWGLSGVYVAGQGVKVMQGEVLL